MRALSETRLRFAILAIIMTTMQMTGCGDGSDDGAANPPRGINVAHPVVEGPISGPPFLAATSFDLAGQGYEATEYFLSGSATAYTTEEALSEDGKWTVAPSNEASYKTRIVVHRPIDPAAFNGTVIVEWLNVSGGLDSAPDWISGHNELIREGYVWVGLSAQYVGVEGGPAVVGVISLPLKTTDPARYGTLVHPGDSFSYDIFSQAAQAIRRPDSADPLGGLKPARVIGVGESQSAFRLVTYINAVHPLADIYDGFLVHSRGAGGAPLSEQAQSSISTPGVTLIRDDVDVPVLTFQTESDLVLLNYFPARQPDSRHFRLWEVAGTAHADTYTVNVGMSDTGDSTAGAKVFETTSLPFFSCQKPINSGPQHFVLKAAIAALNEWVRSGTPPAAAPALEVSAGPPVAIARDANGNALGGIRTPHVDVPIATLSGESQGGSLLCSLFGLTTLFDDAKLATLYPTHAAYVAAVDAATDGAVAAGFIRPADAVILKAAAAESDVGG